MDPHLPREVTVMMYYPLWWLWLLNYLA